MALYAATMWKMMSTDGRLEVMRELRRTVGKDPEIGYDGLSQNEIATIDEFDDLPPNLCGLLTIVADQEGWDYQSLRETLSGGS